MAFFKVRGQEVLDMPADQLRNRTVGSKMTESEYEQLVAVAERDGRSEEHTSELQSRLHLVCRLLLEKKKNELQGTKPLDRDTPMLCRLHHISITSQRKPR